MSRSPSVAVGMSHFTTTIIILIKILTLFMNFGSVFPLPTHSNSVLPRQRLNDPLLQQGIRLQLQNELANMMTDLTTLNSMSLSDILDKLLQVVGILAVLIGKLFQLVE